jgi:hypothetical protein
VVRRRKGVKGSAGRRSYRDHQDLKATERIVRAFELIEEATRSVRRHDLFARARAPLTTAASSPVCGLPWMVVPSMLGVAQGIVDESLHTHGTHGVEEVTIG